VGKVERDLLTRAWSGRTGGDGFKLREGRFRLDMRKKCFTLRVVKPWHRLPREVGDAPSLGTFQAGLDGALSSLVWLKMSLLTAGGWAGWLLKVPSDPNHSIILLLQFYLRNGTCRKVVAHCGTGEPFLTGTRRRNVLNYHCCSFADSLQHG